MVKYINNLTIDGPRGTVPYTLHGDVDFGDNAAIWQYIVHHIRTMNDLQIFLSDNFNYTNLKDFYRQRGGSVPKSLSNSGQINVIRRIAEAFAAHVDTDITGRAVVPLAATDENGCCQELLEIIELPTIKAGEVLSQFERTKHHLKAVENNYQVPATIRYMATMVRQLIEYMKDNEGSCHPTNSGKGSNKPLYNMCLGWRQTMRDELDPPIQPFMRDWLDAIQFHWSLKRDDKFNEDCQLIHKYHMRHGEDAEEYYPPGLKNIVANIRKTHNRYGEQLNSENCTGNYPPPGSELAGIRDYRQLNKERMKLLRSIDFRFTSARQEKTEADRQAYHNAMFELAQQHYQQYKSYDVADPIYNSGEPQYDPLFKFLREINSQFDEGKLNEDDDVIKRMRQMQIPVGLVNRRKEINKAGNRFMTALVEVSLERGITQNPDEIVLEQPIESGRSRKFDFYFSTTKFNAVRDEIIFASPGEADEVGHNSDHYTEEREQRKQLRGIEFANTEEDRQPNLIAYIRADLKAYKSFEKNQPGRKIVEKWVDVLSDALERAKTMNPDDKIVELHMINFTANNRHVLENLDRVKSPILDKNGESISTRAGGEDDWDGEGMFTWDKMFFHTVD